MAWWGSTAPGRDGPAAGALSRYRFKGRVPRTERIRAIIRRARWAARSMTCPAPAAVVKSIRWRFWTSITAPAGYACGGTCDRRAGTLYIDLDAHDVKIGRNDPDDLTPALRELVGPRRVGRLTYLEYWALHELAHATLWTSQGQVRADGSCADGHDAVWMARFFELCYHYCKRGGPDA